MLTGRTALVTGATGRLGPHLCARLEELGARVLPLVLPGYPPEPRALPWTAAAVPIPIDDLAGLNSLPSPDLAINLHWRVDRARSAPEQLVFELERNVAAPAFLWDWLVDRRVRRFVNVSSVHVFGPLNGETVTSADEPRPESPYGMAKLAGEHFFTTHFRDSATLATHLRLASVTSPGEHPSRLVSRLLACAFDGERVTLNSDHRVSILYVDEAVDLLISAGLHGERERYMVAGPTVTVDEVRHALERRIGRPLDVALATGPAARRQPTPMPDVEALRRPWVRAVSLDGALDAMIAARRAGGDPEPVEAQP